MKKKDFSVDLNWIPHTNESIQVGYPFLHQSPPIPDCFFYFWENQTKQPPDILFL